MEPIPERASFTLNNFEIELILSSSQLTIHAKHKINSAHYQAVVTPNNVKELSSHIFPDTEVLYLGLLDAFERTSAGVTISLSDDAKLKYSWQRVFRERTRLETFTITLAEEKKDTLEGLSRQVERLLKKVEKQEERIASLEKENSKLKSDADQALLEKLEMVEMNQKNAIPQVKEFMEKTLQDFEKAADQKFVSIDEKFKFLDKTIVQIIEEFIPKMKEATEKTLLDFEKRLSTKAHGHEELKTQTLKEKAKVSPGSGDWEFDASGLSAKYYIFSNERTTVQYDTTGVSKAIFATRQLLMTQKDKFSVRAEELSSNGHVMIGICPKALRTLEKVSDRRGIYCYFGGSNYYLKSQGFMHISGSSSGLTNCGLTKGAIITVAMDPQMKTVCFDLNGNQIYSGSISLLSDSDEYYPFVEISNRNDKVSFI